MRNYRFIIWTLCIVFVTQAVIAQKNDGQLEGRVSYKSSSAVYVKFNSTSAISVGDTLFVNQNNQLIPALEVTQLSSISGVCKMIADVAVEVDDSVVFQRRRLSAPVETTQVDSMRVDESDPIPQILYTPEPELADLPEVSSSVTGRVALSWYGNFYKTGKESIQRMRYVVALNANNIAGSKFSFESYLSFRHTLGEWSEVQSDFGRWFKAYNLALIYRPNRMTEIAIGRRINRSISNIGAIDGVQYRRTLGKFQVGGFGGFRPDHRTYGFNPDLLQFGVYGSLDSRVGSGSMLNTLAIVQQFRSGATDRRFAYLQHTNTIFKKVYVFTSFEFDLFKNVQDNPESTFRLSSVYLSARYRVSSKLSLFVSYDARNNVIYYETYRNSLDRLIDDETRQGLRLRLNIRPIKRLTVGVSGGYRFQATSGSPATNGYLYVAYSQIPGIKVTVSANYTYLKTDYLQGNIYGLRLSRDIIKGKVFMNVQYRYVDYEYAVSQSALAQNVFSTNVTWRMFGRTAMSVFYEGLFSDWNDYNRFHINLTYRL